MLHNVLFVTTKSELGGGETHLVTLVDNLDRDLFFPRAVCPSKGPLSEELERRGTEVDIIDLGNARSLWGAITWVPIGSLRALLRTVKQKDIDLIHAQHHEALYFSGPVARLAGIPSVYTCNASLFPPRGVMGSFRRFLTDSVIAASEFSKAGLMAAQGIRPDKISVVHNAPDARFFSKKVDSAGIRQEFELGESEIVIGVPANLTGTKGHVYFLQALRRVIEHVPQVRALCVGGDFEGNGPGLQELTEQLGLSKNVTFTGFRSDILEIYDSLDLVVLPSTLENFPLALVEAMARRKPVVATSVGGIPELIEDGKNGLLVPPRDSERLAEAILRVITDADLRETLARTGWEYVRRHFDSRSMAAKNEEVYLKLLGKRRSKAAVSRP